MTIRLNQKEKRRLESIAGNGKPAWIRRARLILLRDEGLPTGQIGEQVGLSSSRVRHWIREYKKRGIDIFPAQALAASGKSGAQRRPSAEATEQGEGHDPEPWRGLIPAEERLETPGISPEDWMSEAGRKILRFHLYCMLDHEAGTRLGEDVLELHDMRVALRRMRSAMKVFRPYFKKGALKTYRAGLRKTGRVLGRVRDLDVSIEKARNHLSAGPSPDPSPLQPLFDTWQAERSDARQRMLKHLNGKRYRRLVKSFASFLENEQFGKPSSKKEPAALRVHQCAPEIIYKRDRVVRSYHSVLAEANLGTLHSLRIDVKRFRYTLEFFQEVLGEEVKAVILSAVELQTHLGDLHDADVACQLLIGFLDSWRAEDRHERVDISGITSYLDAKQAELHQLVADLPRIWKAFTGNATKRELALAVARL